MTEPTDRRIAVLHHSPTYGTIRVYGPLSGGVTAHRDVVVVNGHRLTTDEMRRGWYAPTEAA